MDLFQELDKEPPPRPRRTKRQQEAIDRRRREKERIKEEAASEREASTSGPCRGGRCPTVLVDPASPDAADLCDRCALAILRATAG